jgi:hypothetical protein
MRGTWDQESDRSFPDRLIIERGIQKPEVVNISVGGPEPGTLPEFPLVDLSRGLLELAGICCIRRPLQVQGQ